MLRALRLAVRQLAARAGLVRCRACRAPVPADQRGRPVALIENWDGRADVRHPDPARCPACGCEWPADPLGTRTVHVMEFRCLRPDEYPEGHPGRDRPDGDDDERAE